jgi:hypothetical protein
MYWSSVAVEQASVQLSKPLRLDQPMVHFIRARPSCSHVIMVNDCRFGLVAKSRDHVTYGPEAVVAIAAGYAFTGWSGQFVGSANSKTVTVKGDKIITAMFLLALGTAPS